MKVKWLLIANVVLVLVMVAFAFWVASVVPEGVELPTHWNAAGEIDGTMPPLQALLLPAGISLLVGLVLAAIPFVEPLQNRLEASAPVLRVSWIGLMLMMAFVQLTIAGPALGWEIGPSAMTVPVGVLLIALGNVLPKSRPGFFVGIRTPWTITDTDNWIATHRLGGKLMVLAGAVLLLLGFVPVDASARIALIILAVLGAAVVPIVYSWWLWRRKRAGV